MENYMEVILQIFKRNISSSMPFFESKDKKPLANMDDLFKRAQKYAMLKDELRAASQQIPITNRSTSEGSQSNRKGGGNRKDDRKMNPHGRGGDKKNKQGKGP